LFRGLFTITLQKILKQPQKTASNKSKPAAAESAVGFDVADITA
jgi:hypothetical protein